MKYIDAIAAQSCSNNRGLPHIQDVGVFDLFLGYGAFFPSYQSPAGVL